MRHALTIIIVLVFGFLLGTYLNKNNSNPLTDMKVLSDKVSQMTPKQIIDGLTGDLADKVGNDFDQAYLHAMIINKQSAVTMERLATIAANHKEIRDSATASINIDTKAIEQMKNWQTDLFVKQ